MDNPPNRIKINDDFWFNVQPDKLIFGGAFLPKGYHLTFPFGVKSGKFDLHLTKGQNQFPIVIVEHQDFLIIQSYLIHNLVVSFLNNLRPIDKDYIISEGFEIHAISGFDLELDEEFERKISEGIEALKNSNSSNRLHIDQNSEKFEEFVEGLKSFHESKKMELDKFSELENSLGIALAKDQFLFLIKNVLTQNELYIFDFVNLNSEQIIRETLGEDLAAYIFNSIENGKHVLAMENATDIIADMEPPIMSVESSS